ncbi:hypothetical protein EDD16DRAFT_1527921 [Pisolithus croceorrhizus]|nr:hypothetical protein EDD16DRAFT_1527921 [Pisolithus croceorrhizus]
MVGGFSMATTKLFVRVKVVFSGRAIGGTHCFRLFEDINCTFAAEEFSTPPSSITKYYIWCGGDTNQKLRYHNNYRAVNKCGVCDVMAKLWPLMTIEVEQAINLPNNEPVNAMAPSPHHLRKKKGPNTPACANLEGLTMVPAGARDNNVVELAWTSVQAEQGGCFSFQLRDPPCPTYVGSQSLDTFQGHQMNSSVTTKNEFLSGLESENFYPHCHVREDGDDIDFQTDTENPSLHSPSGDSAANGFQEYIDKRAAASIPEMTQCTTLQHSTPPWSSYVQQKVIQPIQTLVIQNHSAPSGFQQLAIHPLQPPSSHNSEKLSLCVGDERGSAGDSQDYQSSKRQCLEPPEQPEEDATDPKGDSAMDQVHHGRYSRNAKGTIPIKPMLIAFYPPLWTTLLNLAKAHTQLGWPVPGGSHGGCDLKKVVIESLCADYDLYPPMTAKTEEQHITAVKKKANDLLSMVRYLHGEPDDQIAEFQEYVPYRALVLVTAMKTWN